MSDAFILSSVVVTYSSEQRLSTSDQPRVLAGQRHSWPPPPLVAAAAAAAAGETSRNKAT